MADVLAVRNKYRMENWSALIRECNASGLSNREFCQQLGDPVYPNLAEATVPAYETGLAGRHRNSRG